MAQQIQDLVASIQKEGIDKANAEAAKIIADAKEQAAKIVADGKKEADKLVTDAQRDIELRDQSAKAGLKQAARDVQLSLRNALEKQLNGLLETKIAKAYSSDNLVKLIKEILLQDIVDPSKTELQLSQKDFDALGKTLVKELGDAVRNGLEIKPVKSVSVGFRLSDKDGSGYYDFSDEDVAKLMLPFLSPAIAEIIGE
ncbi:MAG: V-type ATP synthase subunit E [Spirochaetia bacterium]|jgi:V/A-type H+-transporting ATPase subunit E|nr:V-type ATP synthase subunit E [Spirochaetia bacterium]